MNSAETSSPVAIITGATGFIGSRLAAALAKRGWTVHAIVRAGAELKELAPHVGAIQIHRFDGETDSLIALVKAVRPDIGFHLASLFLAQHKPGDIPALIQSNVTFGTQLLEAFAAAGVNRFINTGTAWQHFEDAEYCPVNLYAASKQAFEAIVRYYTEATHVRVTTLKLFDTYGLGDPRSKVISLVLQAAKTGKPLDMSPGEQKIDLVHVDDVIMAFVMAADRMLKGSDSGHEQYAVSSGKAVSLRTIVGCIESLIGRKIPVNFGIRPYRPREVMQPWTRGRSVPGWAPARSLDAGLHELFLEAGIVEGRSAIDRGGG